MGLTLAEIDDKKALKVDGHGTMRACIQDTELLDDWAKEFEQFLLSKRKP